MDIMQGYSGSSGTNLYQSQTGHVVLEIRNLNVAFLPSQFSADFGIFHMPLGFLVDELRQGIEAVNEGDKDSYTISAVKQFHSFLCHGRKLRQF